MTLSRRPCHSRVLLQGPSRGHTWSYRILSLRKYRRGRLEGMYLWESAIADIFYIRKNHNILFVSLFLCNFLQSQYINFRTPISKPDCRRVCRAPASISSRVLRVLSQEVGGCGSSAPGLMGADAIPGMLMPIAIRGRNLKTWVRGYCQESPPRTGLSAHGARRQALSGYARGTRRLRGDTLKTSEALRAVR